MLSEKDSGGGGFCVKKPDRPMPAADCGCSGPTLVKSCAAERVRRMRRGATPLGHGVTHMLGESLVSSIARRGIQAARAAQSAMALMGGGFGRHSVAPRFGIPRCRAHARARSFGTNRRLLVYCCWWWTRDCTTRVPSDSLLLRICGPRGRLARGALLCRAAPLPHAATGTPWHARRRNSWRVSSLARSSLRASRCGARGLCSCS